MFISIGFSRPKGFKVGASLISWWIKKPYSHVFIQIEDNNGRELVFQASHGMVHLVTLEHFVRENKILLRYPINLNPEESSKCMSFILDKLGMPYNFLDLINIVLWDVGIKLPQKDQRGYVCSELASRMLKEIKHIELDKPTWLMRPDDVELLLKNMGDSANGL